MKAVLKTSLVAASVAMAFSASAAQIIVAPGNSYKLSEEGLSVGLKAPQDLTFDVAVQKNHPATSVIELKFPTAAVDLSNVASGTCGAPISGSFTCGGLTFNVGTGNFTFDNVIVNATDGTIKFSVNLGNSLSADSAFRVKVGSGLGSQPVMSGAFSVDYESTFGGNVIETGTGVLATTAPQFTASVASRYSHVIERLLRATFVAPNAGTTDSLTFNVKNNTNLLAAATFVDMDADLGGKFSQGYVASPLTPSHYNGTFQIAGGPAGVVQSGNTNVLFAGINTAPVAAGTNYVMNFDRTGGLLAKIDTQKFDLSLDVNFSDGATVTDSKTLLAEANAGQWRLDASVVNVPYLPMNLGLSPNVEIANEGASDAEITMEAIDNVTGAKYGPVVLVHRTTGNPVLAAGESVTTVTEADMIKSFGAFTDKRKMSVTFIIDANEDDITLSPYYRQNESRVNVMTDQYRK